LPKIHIYACGEDGKFSKLPTSWVVVTTSPPRSIAPKAESNFFFTSWMFFFFFCCLMSKEFWKQPKMDAYDWFAVCSTLWTSILWTSIIRWLEHLRWVTDRQTHDLITCRIWNESTNHLNFDVIYIYRSNVHI